MQRTGPSGGISIKKVICPPEIAELKTGQMSNATICIEFANIPDREGDMTARLDINSSTAGSMPVELKPSLGELLLPLQVNKSEYESTMDRMQGFQRIVSSFQSNVSSSSSTSSSRNEVFATLATRVLKCAALTPVGKSSSATTFNKERQFKLVGSLPTSKDIVLVLVQLNDNATTDDDGTNVISGTITVCCDHAVAVNSIMNVIKRTLND